MSEDEDFQMPVPDPALEKLNYLVGTWEAVGTIEEGPLGPGGQTSGTETFEWLEGGFFLLHRWEGTMTMGGQEMSDIGYEFFDTEPATGQYRTHFFNNLGPYDDAGSKYHGGFEGDELVVTGPARIIRRPNADGTITVVSEIPSEDGSYVPFMTTTLTKVG